MTDLLQLVFSGLAQGTIYGLVALGFVAIFAVREIVNLVQGEYAALAGLAAISAVGAGLPLLVVCGVENRHHSSGRLVVAGSDDLREQRFHLLEVNLSNQGHVQGSKRFGFAPKVSEPGLSRQVRVNLRQRRSVVRSEAELRRRKLYPCLLIAQFNWHRECLREACFCLSGSEPPQRDALNAHPRGVSGLRLAEGGIVKNAD